MLLLNRFGPYSNSWHVTVNSDVKLTMHSLGVHDVVVHDVGMHDMSMHYMAMHDRGVPGMGVPRVDNHITCNFFIGKKIIFLMPILGKKANFFLFICR
jgi:hypothetical protein